jgi:hypothetical protein
VPATTWEEVRPEPSKLACFNRYYEHNEPIKTTVSANEEVRVYKSSDLKFVGVIIGVGIPIPLGIPKRDTVAVEWDSGTCTTSGRSTKFLGCMTVLRFEEGMFACGDDL